MRVAVASQADVATLLQTLDSAVSQTLQAREARLAPFEHASPCRAQMHAADGLSAEAADALRVPLAAMTVRAGRGSAAGAAAGTRPTLKTCAAGERQGAAFAQRDVPGRRHEVRLRRRARRSRGCAPGRCAERLPARCSCENAAASGVVTAVPVPEMPTPALLNLDESSAAMQAELAEVAQRVAVLREQVPNTLRDCAVSLQKTLRSAASSVAASAAGTTLTALQAVAAPGSDAGVVSAEATAAAAGALVPVDHALAMTADLSESVASLPAVADRLQARSCRRSYVQRLARRAH